MLLLSLKNKTFSCSTSVRWVGEEEKLNEIKKKKKKKSAKSEKYFEASSSQTHS